MSRTVLLTLIVGLVVFLPSAARATLYSGSLSTDDGGIVGTGKTIAWSVSENEDLSWHYEYTVAVSENEHDVSHFTIEVSDTFEESHIFNESGPFDGIEIRTYVSGAPGDPDFPEDFFGMKFDDIVGGTFTISFDAWRMPMWGDFSTKIANDHDQAWNAGFVSPDTDPSDEPADGTVDNHILVPDTYVPEPATICILGLGSFVLFARKKQ
jgi:hypothetical protein